MCPDRHLQTADEVDVHLRSLIAWHAKPMMSLSDVCRLAHGAYPTEVHAQAAILRGLGQIGSDAQLLHHNPAARSPLEVANSLLPLPHPRDFEWRFSRAGCDAISAAISSTVRSSDATVALLGTSGYAEHLARTNPPFQARLFELRSDACAVIDQLGAIAVTVGNIARTWRLFPNTFDCIVADPPWYPETVKLFVQAAAGLLRDGGTLFLCTPGLTTRPGLPAERLDMLRSAAADGLILDQLLPRSVEYESPPFELSALEASGLDGFSPYWRLADLVTFRRLPEPRPAVNADAGEQLSMDDGWAEVRLGRARVKINTSPAQPIVTDRPLDTVVPGNVLDTVSSRDHRRQTPNIWTTTNRIYSTNQPVRLLEALQANGRGHNKQDNEYAEAAALISDEELYALRSFGIE